MQRYEQRQCLPQVISVAACPGDHARGRLRFGGWSVPCALGRGGITHAKREGDGATPAGRFALVSVYYRPDRELKPQTDLPVRPIGIHDGWCDDPGEPRYNRPVRLPFAGSHERLWRDDHLYDLVVVLDCNLVPARRGRGSAIFFHVARPNFAPTAGCVAIEAAAMRRLLGWLRPGAVMEVKG